MNDNINLDRDTTIKYIFNLLASDKMEAVSSYLKNNPEENEWMQGLIELKNKNNFDVKQLEDYLIKSENDVLDIAMKLIKSSKEEKRNRQNAGAINKETEQKKNRNKVFRIIGSTVAIAAMITLFFIIRNPAMPYPDVPLRHQSENFVRGSEFITEEIKQYYLNQAYDKIIAHPFSEIALEDEAVRLLLGLSNLQTQPINLNGAKANFKFLADEGNVFKADGLFYLAQVYYLEENKPSCFECTDALIKSGLNFPEWDALEKLHKKCSP